MLRAGLLGLIALVAGGCAPAVVAEGPLQPLVVGAELHFTLEWQGEPREQATLVWGYLGNRSPYTFDRVRLLVDALGPADEIAGQQLIWVPGLLGGGGRAYFEVSMPPASGYRVRVFSYDRVETDRWRRRPFR